MVNPDYRSLSAARGERNGSAVATIAITVAAAAPIRTDRVTCTKATAVGAPSSHEVATAVTHAPMIETASAHDHSDILIAARTDQSAPSVAYKPSWPRRTQRISNHTNPNAVPAAQGTRRNGRASYSAA